MPSATLDRPATNGLVAPQGAATPEPAPPKVAKASDFRKVTREGQLVELPGSHLIVRLRKPSLMAMAAQAAYIPNPLAREILKYNAVSNNRDADDDEQIRQYQENTAAFIKIAQLAFVEPRMVVEGEPKDDELGPLDLPDRDLMWIVFSWVEGEARPLIPFPEASRATARQR